MDVYPPIVVSTGNAGLREGEENKSITITKNKDMILYSCVQRQVSPLDFFFTRDACIHNKITCNNNLTGIW
jgi:hypothetical protein